MGNLTGNVFDKDIIKQIEARQIFLGSRYKSDPNLIYSNNNSSFLRLASSVNVDAPQLLERDLSENLQGDLLAKSCVLFGGIIGIDDTLNPIRKFGIVDNGGSGEYDYVSTIAAYGWGGIDKGFVPMPNIESADVSFFNRGALQKAKVKIKVFSLQQLQIFDLLYFRIGYTMLLEWGHNIILDNDVDPIKNPNPIKVRNEFTTSPFTSFFSTDGVSQQTIIQQIKSQRLQDNYNYDAMLGKVTNFTWTYNDDGTYDIDLNLVGLGDIIESLKINTTGIVSGNAPPPTKTNEELIAENDKKSQILDKKKNATENSTQNTQQLLNDKLTAANKEINRLVGLLKNEIVFDLRSWYQENVFSKIVSLTDDFTNNQNVYNALNKINSNPNSSLAGAKAMPNLKKLKAFVNHITQADLKSVGAANAAANAQNLLYQKQQDEINKNNLLLKKDSEIKKLSPITSVENKDKTAFNKQLYLWRTEIDKSVKSDNLYLLKLKASSEVDPNNKLALNFYYVRLGYLLEWIEKNLLLYDTTKKYDKTTNTDNRESTYISSIESPGGANPIFEIDYNPNSNFCLSYPAQFSTDPAVCIIPSKYNKDGTKWDILPKLASYFTKTTVYAGKMMNIFVCIDKIAGVLDSNTDVNGKTNLLKFLSALCNEINDALGNVNKIEPVFDSDSNKLKLIEGSTLDNVDDLLKEAAEKEAKEYQIAEFQVYGIGTDASPQGSFITNVDFQVQLPPNMAAMATISAQAGGNIVGENATGLSALNKGLTDRLISVKLDRDSIEGAQATGELDPAKIFKKNIDVVSAFVSELYDKELYNTATVENTRSSNRDVALYLTGNDAIEGLMPAPFFIPFNLSLNMKGLAGMRNYERFSITEKILPYSYRTGNQGGVIDFLIKGISHTIKDNKWETKIESLTVSSNRKYKGNK
jgi:hypothetical protein